jgi:membrane fusion protein, copper/silver efflux system
MKIKKSETHFPYSIYHLTFMLLLLIIVLTGCSDHKSNEKTTDLKVYYTCTMHPEVISNKPGVCPICNMELVKRTVDDKAANQKDMEGMITLSD